MLKVRLLGAFDIKSGNKSIALTSRPAQSLFAYLVLSAGTSHRREKLAGQLWPEAREEAARDYLRHALWRIRKALATASTAHLLKADDLTVMLTASPEYRLDTAVLMTAAECKTASTLMKALSAYGGELLPGFYEDWVLLEREHLQSMYEQELGRLLSMLQASSRWPQLLEWAEKWIALGRRPEPAFRALMTAHAATGDMAAVAAAYKRCVQALGSVGVEPSAQTQELYRRVQVEQAPRGPRPATPAKQKEKQRSGSRLPVPLTTFVGRRPQLRELRGLIARNRLVTLVGTGGVGKTRLAIELGHRMLDEFGDGLWWTDLGSVTEPSKVPEVLASVLGVRERPGMPLSELLVIALASLRGLLVMDNCEHLISACASLASRLLGGCPGLVILATSREALGIPGEVVWRVPSLSIPDPERVERIRDLQGKESVRLFADRARALQTDFRIDDRNARSVAQICQKLDGIPLAIELAAARVQILSPEEISARLDHRFDLLSKGSSTAIPRHQTLRAAIDWSYELLSPPEKILLRSLAVFAGGWTLEAAEEVMGGLGVSRWDTLELLSKLVDKSLVAVQEGAPSTRYRLLETVREYAFDKLTASSDLALVRRLHFDYFRQFADAARVGLDSPRYGAWLPRVEAELQNLRSAIEWGTPAVPDAIAQLVSALIVFWIVSGREAEARAWICAALGRTAGPLSKGEREDRCQLRTRADAVQAMIYLSSSGGDHGTATRLYDQAIQLARELGDDGALARALAITALDSILETYSDEVEPRALEGAARARKASEHFALGWSLVALSDAVLLGRHDRQAAQGYADEGLQSLTRAARHPFFTALAVFSLGTAARQLGDHAEARRRLSECLPMFRAMGDKRRINVVLSELAHIERTLGHLAEAERLYRETLPVWKSLGHRAAVASQLECFGLVAKAQGREQRAVRLLAAASRLRQRIAAPRTHQEQLEYEKGLNELRVSMTKDQLEHSWALGQSMGMEQAVEEALDLAAERPKKPAAASGPKHRRAAHPLP